MIGFQAERRDQTCSSFSLANADESSPRSDNQGIRNLKKPERRNDENGSLTDLQPYGLWTSRKQPRATEVHDQSL